VISGIPTVGVAAVLLCCTASYGGHRFRTAFLGSTSPVGILQCVPHRESDDPVAHEQDHYQEGKRCQPTNEKLDIHGRHRNSDQEVPGPTPPSPPDPGQA